MSANEKVFKEAHNDVYTDTSNFATLVNKSWYVDKTLLIKAIFKDMDKILITTPRRFGKSTNLNMLKTFFEIETNLDGQRVRLVKDKAGYLMKEQPHSKNFALFKDTKIFTIEEDEKQIFDKTFFTNHFGRYPTIYVDFKNVEGNTYDEILVLLRTAISKSYQEHHYLQKLNSEFTKYIDQHQTLSEEEVEWGLKRLSEILCDRFKYDKKVYVFIDNYDAPISNAMFNQSFPELEIGKPITIISAIISRLLKDNPNVEMAFLTGCLHVGDSSFPSNIVQHSFGQSKIFNSFYGFTEDEVEHLLTKKGLDAKINKVESWYYGYNSKLCVGNQVAMYNTWSIINYLRTDEIRNFWPVGSLNKLLDIEYGVEYWIKVKSLMRWDETTIKYHEKLGITDIKNLKVILKSKKIYSNENASLFLQLLYENGYLNIVNEIVGFLELKIPNDEVYTEICRSLFSLDFFKRYYGTDQRTIDTFCESLRRASQNKTEKWFIKLANSIRNLYINEDLLTLNDFEFQAFMFYSLNQSFQDTRGLPFTRPKTCERCDIVLVVNNVTGIVMELKIFDNGNSVDAFKEILAERYYFILDKKSVEDQIYLGIHMDKKKNITITYLINSHDEKLAKTVRSDDVE